MVRSSVSRARASLALAVSMMMLALWTAILPAHAETRIRNDLLDTFTSIFGGNTEAMTESSDTVTRRVPLSAGDVQLSFAPLVRQSGPSVVNVYAERLARQQRSPFEGDPFFEQFFGRGFFDAPPRVQSSLGSGVIVDPSGIIVTNFHVIEGADEIRIALADGREYPSQLVFSDKGLDLAVMRIDAGETLPAIELANSDTVEVGDLVLAIGNPFGVGQTTTSGIISATARSRIGASEFGFFLQTDAAINPGNSGGALIDLRGDLVGINTAIFTRSGGSNGIGFAIPSNMVRVVVEQAREGLNTFQQPWIGASFDAVSPDVAESLGMTRPYGALVRRVAPDSPADDAGLRPGDVILSFNDVEIEHPDALGYRMAIGGVDVASAIDVLRPQGRVSLELTPTAPQAVAALRKQIDGNNPFGGIVAEVIDTNEGPRLQVAELLRGSPAARAGFRPGDLILRVNGADTTSPDILQEIANEGARFWRVALVRNGRLINQMFTF